jgi:putative membrane-bound dehydrogenase-like protein
MSITTKPLIAFLLLYVMLPHIALIALAGAASAAADDDALLFTTPGFARPGQPRSASAPDAATLRITVVDRASGKPTACRLNVVGPDGNFYQPRPTHLTPYSLTWQWPKTGKGNREGKAPYRYYGRFFYSTGQVEVKVPAGAVRVEAFKGFEYRPALVRVEPAAGVRQEVKLELDRAVDMRALGHHSGDPHLHFARRDDADDRAILDLMEAEDIGYGSILAYNEPAGPYTGTMESMDSPQLRGLGKASVARRGDYLIASGQEYRSGTYGHLNLYWRDGLVLPGQKVNADNWPLYGQLGRETLRQGGLAIYAHGGYAQAIYADVIQKNVSAVELLQFGVYRGIELADWYAMLNIGLRIPCVGASDYPACRALGDCRTYVASKDRPDFEAWLRGAAAGRSFVTTAPLLFLEVDGRRPGDAISLAGPGPHSLRARVRVISEAAPVDHIQVVVGGKVVHERNLPSGEDRSRWIELEQTLAVDRSSWVAARAYSKSASGLPDAEAHTNPVYIDVDGKGPFDRDALDRLVARIDQQMAAHRKRSFPEKAKVLDDFQKSRDILLRIRQADGLPASGVPDEWIEDRTATSFDPTRRSHSDDELKRFLTPLPAKTPDEAMKTFETVDGFRLELVAAEPLAASPVAAAFDADGSLYVGEMRDYPYKPKPGRKPLGTVRLLRDTDGDGTFDRAHVFADGLLWATGIAPWKGGVFVASPPDIWYLKDTDGDFVADLRRRVFTGFGTQNQQAMLNNLTWGLDHKIYGATAQNGGAIRHADRPDAPPVLVDGHDFRFDPVTERFESITGTIQFGNTFDDWGNRFLCSESHPLLQPVLPQHYLARNPYLAVPSAIEDIAKGAVPIFRISPIERWRQIRSSRRIAHGERSAESAGASHHVIDAAAGVTVYRGTAYPAEFYGNVFVGDAQNNLVHRRVLIPDGPTFRSERAPREPHTEFVRSSDNWFRPVNFVNAPDGTLYVLDMSREILEAIHIPLDVVKHLDLKRGRDQGRIYRIAPPGFRYTPPPRLSTASTAELVAYLGRKDAWYRDTARRLIYERQDRSAVGALRELIHVAQAPLPQTRVDALWALQGLGTLRDEDLLSGMADRDPRVRAQALMLAEGRLDASPKLREAVLAMAGDADPRVRFQAAFSLGEMKDARAISALARIARTDAANRWTLTAVLSSCGATADRLFAELWNDPRGEAFAGGEPRRIEVLEQVVQVVGARHRAEEIGRVLDELAGASDPASVSLRFRLILALGAGLRRSGVHLPVGSSPDGRGYRLLARMVEEARDTARDEQSSEDSRRQAIALLSLAPPGSTRPDLVELLEPRHPAKVQVAALKALAEDGDSKLATLLIEKLAGFAPAVRAAAVQTLLGREAWARTFLRLAAGEPPPPGLNAALIEPSARAPLLKHRDPEIARLARDLFQQGPSRSRAQVVADYLESLRLKGDAARGQTIFVRECKACHKIGELGVAIGPDLTGSPSRDAAAMLNNILDPNSNVLPGYVQYVASDKDGRNYSGIIAAETASSLTLRRGDGAEDTLLRSQVEAMTSTGQSLMPEGLEKTVTKQDMADLIAFLRASHRGDDGEEAADQGTPPKLDIGTLPGLIEPDESPR